jgi:DNA adenine methylase
LLIIIYQVFLKKLIKLILELDKDGIKFSLSNSNSEILKKCFKNFNIKEIEARRAINSKNPESITTEILVNN